MRRMIISFASLLFFTSQVYAASFDCAKAKSTMEKTVCSDAKLSALDDELAKLYEATKTELIKRPKDLNSLIKNQRYWSKLLNNEQSAAKVESLRDDYELRVKQMRNKFNLARATQPDATGPSKEAVIKRLSEQLMQFKKLAHRAEKVEILYAREEGENAACETVWKSLKLATMPEPMEYANTGQQKRDLYMQLRKMALHNKRLFLSQGNVIEDLTFFNYFWKTYDRKFSEFDDTRRDSANLLFSQPDTRDGFKRAVLVAILLDLDNSGQTLISKELLPDGLFGGAGSFRRPFQVDEYHNDIPLDERQSIAPKPVDYTGLMTLENKIMLWEMYSYADNGGWIVYIRPVRNITQGQQITCTYSLDPAMAKKTKEAP